MERTEDKEESQDFTKKVGCHKGNEKEISKGKNEGTLH